MNGIGLSVMDVERADDVEAIFDMHSRMEIIRWLGEDDPTPMTTREEAQVSIQRWVQAEAADPLVRRRAIRDLATGEVLGTVQSARLIPVGGEFAGEYEIGWALRPSATGRGAATSGARLLARDLFASGLERLVIDMWPENQPSVRVAQRLGAEDLGVIEDPWYGGEGRVFRLRPEHLDAL